MAEGLGIRDWRLPGIATVMARKGCTADAIGAAVGAEFPAGPAVTCDGTVSVLGTGPGSWLVLGEDQDHEFTERYAEKLAGLASVSDQSSGYAVIELSGPVARRVLQRGAPIDLHPDSFASGSVATTVIAHIGVTIWRNDAPDTFTVAVFRSLYESFRHWLEEVAEHA